eukprot:9138295-Pyramimonas_sp.AAC.1
MYLFFKIYFLSVWDDLSLICLIYVWDESDGGATGAGGALGVGGGGAGGAHRRDGRVEEAGQAHAQQGRRVGGRLPAYWSAPSWMRIIPPERAPRGAIVVALTRANRPPAGADSPTGTASSPAAAVSPSTMRPLKLKTSHLE